jgi:hypothetical protein
MAQKVTAAMPIEPDLTGGWQLIWAALDPTTGAPVAGVTVSGAAITVETEAQVADLLSGPFMLIPGPQS